MHSDAMSVKYERPRPFGDIWKYEPDANLSLEKKILRKGMLFPSSRDVELPRLAGKVPVYTEVAQIIRLAPFIVAPIAARWALQEYTNVVVPHWAMFLGLLAWLLITYGVFLKYLQGLSLQYGYLDGNVERDSIPAGLTHKLSKEIICGVICRPLMAVLLTYDPHARVELSWWLPLQVCVFSIMMDFMYYWVHRFTHENNALWYLHKRHHTTKHPIAYLLGFADEPQEWFDLLASPTFAQMVYPLNFDTFYVWMQLLVVTEIFGHSGLRIYYPSPTVGRTVGTTNDQSGAFLRPFGCDGTVEDHDLHHRFGWQDSGNYGKSSALWDKWFGTQLPRIECAAHNVDWSKQVW